MGRCKRHRSEHRLIAELRQEEGGADCEHRPATFALCSFFVVCAELIAADRPGGEGEIGESGNDVDWSNRERRRGDAADRNGAGMDEQRSERNPEHRWPEAVARGKGERHQLALVAKLRHKDERRGEEEGVIYDPPRCFMR